MKDITYNKTSLIRSVRYFNEYEEEDKTYSALALGEELMEKVKRIDSWLSDEKGFHGNKFDWDDDDHIRLFAKLDLLNEELMDIIEKSKLDAVEIH